MTTLADIASGNTNAADIFFLVAVILAFLAVLCELTSKIVVPIIVFIAGAVGCIAFGLMLL